MEIVSTKMTNTIARNVMSTAIINCHSRKSKRFLHTVLLVITLLLIMIIICNYYAKQKGINAMTI